MRETETKVFECEICGRKGVSAAEMQIHEEDCRAQKAAFEASLADRKRKRAERLEKAVAWARESEPVLLLVEHGFRTQARLVCREWASYSLWDCGTSSGWEEVYDHMLQAAEEVVKERKKVDHG